MMYRLHSCVAFYAFCLLGQLTALAVAAPAAAQSGPSATQPGPGAPVPIFMGDPALLATLLSPFDQTLFAQALDAMKANRWAEAKGLIERIKDGAAHSYASWRFYINAPEPDVEAMMAFVKNHGDWPSLDKILWKIERGMRLSAQGGAPLNPPSLRAWFDVYAPVSGTGKILYGEALIQAGQNANGQRLIERAWIEHDFDPADEIAFLAQYAPSLSAATHRARLERQLWERDTKEAARSEIFVDEPTRLLSIARRKLIDDAPGAELAVAAVPAQFGNDPGLMVERIRWYRRHDLYPEAKALLLIGPKTAAGMVDPEKWWVERNSAVRKALEARDFTSAYLIASNHGLKKGPGFAEGEWLSGWLALRFLNQPQTALQHFEKLYVGTGTPISKARGAYWSGRAALAAKRPVQAGQMLQIASLYPFTFYGQLAQQSLSRDAQGSTSVKLNLPSDPAIDAETRTRFQNRPLIRAIQIAYAFELKEDAERFILFMSEKLQAPGELYLLSATAQRFGLDHIGVRAGKNAAQRMIDTPSQTFPIPPLVKEVQAGLPHVELAFVLGISRQESEFNARALSSAGARGYMQLMPGTATLTARKHGLTRGGSLEDPRYNIELGIRHLGDLLDEFGGSYIMTIAAYNAGPSRVREWIVTFGDPRSAEIDPIDWIESVPFTETRNYVQRVLENISTYRARLNGNSAPLSLAQDLARGADQRGNLHPTHMLADAPQKPGIHIAVAPDARLPEARD